ncbi:MAG: hypothetical protein M0T83_08415 [Nitrospiraceae bacterium]|nr:hypothetical protein [Nitrospiraceae bacterium]
MNKDKLERRGGIHQSGRSSLKPVDLDSPAEMAGRLRLCSRMSAEMRRLARAYAEAFRGGHGRK